MRNRNIVIDFGMTFDAPYISKMGCLVWKPVMLFDNINFLLVGKKLEPVKIGVAIKTNCIIIGNSLLKIVPVPYTDLVAVRVMALPA